MSKLRTLIEVLPKMAGCIDADRFSGRNVAIHDLEIAEKDSIYAYRETDKVHNRLAVLEIPEEFIVDKEVYRAGMNRMRIAMLSYDKHKGRITVEQEQELVSLTLITEVKLEDNNSAEKSIEEVYPLEVATNSIWS